MYTIIALVIIVAGAAIYFFMPIGDSDQNDKIKLLIKNGIDADSFISLSQDKISVDPALNTAELWAINSELVFYYWTSPNTMDGNYGAILYGKAPSDQICSSYANVGGPQIICEKDQYKQLFSQLDTRIGNIGLGNDYKVVKFYPKEQQIRIAN